MYDIVIVGAGPAGANLARLVSNKYKVLLIDKRDFENTGTKKHSNKCCGGLLAPDAQKMVAKLNLGIPKDILVDPQLFAVRTIDLSNNLERLYQRFYFNMDRDKFDKWLISLIPSAVEKKFSALFKGYTKIPEGYEVRYVFDGKEESIKTKIIVAADGAFSKIRKSICEDKREPKTYIAIQEWFEACADIPYFTAIFDKEITDFYSWIIPKENFLLLGSALKPGKEAKEKFETLKTKLKKLGFNFDKKIKTEGSYIYRPEKLSQFCAGKDAIALIGEAAGAISPSSAEGISYALKSSLYLARELEKGLDGFLDRYKKKVKEIKRNLFFKNLKSPAMYNSALRRLIMKSGIQSFKNEL